MKTTDTYLMIIIIIITTRINFIYIYHNSYIKCITKSLTLKQIIVTFLMNQ